MHEMKEDCEQNMTQSYDEELVEDEAAAISIFKKANRPVTLKFENVVYKIKTKKSGLVFRGTNSKLEDKVILKGITGAVLPGEMLAILGPSGSGKTTLLAALGGRLGGHLSGNITYNGKLFCNDINRTMGFVAQEDKFHPHLTVAETLVFTALLRLPNPLQEKEKVMQAEAVISQLGLTKCKNSIMGGPFLRGVSGGERKRVSIGQEIMINPNLLFLDEPTSGLDSTSAQEVVSMLWELARGGRTVLISIHQPSSRLFYMFGKILLLSDGKPLYFGKGEKTMDYFCSICYAPSVTMNPADFLLDLANGVHFDHSNMKGKAATKQALVSAYERNLADRLKEELQEIDNQLSEDDSTNKRFDRWSTTWIQQFLVLLRRDLKERKHESFSGMKISQVLIISFLCGLLWWQSTSAHLQDQIGLLFYYSFFWGLIPLFQALITFPQELMILNKERQSSMYRLSSYCTAKMVGDLPMELALPTVFVTITYWMAGLKPIAGHFFRTLFVILYGALVSQGLGLAVGAIVMNIKSAVTLGTIILQTLFLTAGYYVEHVPGFISWAKYLSLTHYTYKLLLWSQYENDNLYPCAPNVSCRVGDNPTIKKMGLGNPAISFVALGLMFVGYRIVVYVSLTRVGVLH